MNLNTKILFLKYRHNNGMNRLISMCNNLGKSFNTSFELKTSTGCPF